MGAKSSIQSQGEMQLSIDQWIIINKNYPYPLQYDIVQHPRDINSSAEIWVIAIASDAQKTEQQEMEMYKYRRQTKLPFVKCLGYQSVQTKSVGLCGKEKIIKVMTERIIARWDQFPQLTYLQCLYTLKQSLFGFSQLYKMNGIFSVNDKMIGINSEGYFKVWLNPNFGKNQPEINKRIIDFNNQNSLSQPLHTETGMVKNILHIIEEKCQEGRYPQSLRILLYNSAFSFSKVNEFLLEHIKQKQIELPLKIYPNLNFMLQKSETIPTFGQYSQTEPYDLNRINQNRNQRNVNKVINFVNLKPASYRPKEPDNKIKFDKILHPKIEPMRSHRPSQRFQTQPSHPSELRGDSRIVRVPKLNVIRPQQNLIQLKSQEVKSPTTPTMTPFQQTFNFLKNNPHIMTAESVYQSINKTKQGENNASGRYDVQPSKQFLQNNKQIYETKYILVDKDKQKEVISHDDYANRTMNQQIFRNNNTQVQLNLLKKQPII